MNKVLLRVNEIQITDSDIKRLNQKVHNGEREVSLFQFYMEERGVLITDHPEWKLMTDGYYLLCFQTDQSMRLLNGIKGFLKKYLNGKRIHVYIVNLRKEQYYQLVPKDDDFLELECGYSLKRKPRLKEQLIKDIDKCYQQLNHPQIDEMMGGDEYPKPLFHTKILRKETIQDEFYDNGQCKPDWYSHSREMKDELGDIEPTIVHERQRDIHPEDKWRKKQYSFFVNTFNYKNSLLKDSQRIIRFVSNWVRDTELDELLKDKKHNVNLEPIFQEVK